MTGGLLMSDRPAESRSASEVAEALWERSVLVDARITKTLKRISLLLIRISLAIIFLWFGLL
jgi:hypothetical protein